MGSFLEFAKAAVKNPLQVSTLFQTGPRLRDLLLSTLPLQNSKLVIELGPGAGAITSELLKFIPDDAYVGIELSPQLVSYLRREFPGKNFVVGSAELCEDIAKEKGPADAVVSSLPWTVFPFETQKRIIQSVSSSLREGGVFATYVCLNATLYPSAKNLKSLLNSHFRHVEKTPVEWCNIPPAFVYACTK